MVSDTARFPGITELVVLRLLSDREMYGYEMVQSIALRTGSSQAAQAGFLLFFPLLFLSPAFAPKEIFSGWLEFLATINPVSSAPSGNVAGGAACSG